MEKELDKLLEQHKLMETIVNGKQEEFQQFLQRNGFTLRLTVDTLGSPAIKYYF